MWPRKIKPERYTRETIDIFNPNEIYAEMPNAYVLAHADDGVIWGRVRDGKLLTEPALRDETLRQIRLFNEERELFFWRTSSLTPDWQGRRIVDGQGESISTLDENHMLWGTGSVDQSDDGFTLLEEGAQDLNHAIPIPTTLIVRDENGRIKERWRAALVVRHYISEAENGLNRITLSRLYNLKTIQLKEVY